MMDGPPPLSMGSGGDRPDSAALIMLVLESQRHLRRALNMLQVAAWALFAAAIAILVAILVRP